MTKLSTDAFELDKIYPTVTPDEEHRIVHEGATAVDEILGNKKPKAETSSGSRQTATSGLSISATTAGLQKSSNAGVTTTTVTNATVTVDLSDEDGFYDEEGDVPVGMGSVDVSNMSEEDFFKKVESGNF